MSVEKLTKSFPWLRYSKKLQAKIEHPHHIGIFRKRESEERKMCRIMGEAGNSKQGYALWLYWLVEPNDGTIVDVRFQVLGHSALIGAAEVAAELLIGKNYDQARRISADLLDTQVRDKRDISAFPEETASHLNVVLDAIDNAAEQCVDIPLPTGYVAPPVGMGEIEAIEGGYPGWETFSNEQKVHIIRKVVQQDVQPYIELDAGGVEVKSLEKGREVMIAYQGSCTSCYSATGATLSYIQHVLQAKVHPDLEVIPEIP